jgi:hypothetical protein
MITKALARRVRASSTVVLSFDDTFVVYDYVTQERIGEITLMSEGWASYRGRQQGRLGTFPTAEAAIRSLDKNPGKNPGR